MAVSSSRQFISGTGIGTYTHLQKRRNRLEYLTMHVVRQRAMYDTKGKFLGWVISTTDIPLSTHGKHFLRQNGWPIPGNPGKCNLSVCQLRPTYVKKGGDRE